MLHAQKKKNRKLSEKILVIAEDKKMSEFFFKELNKFNLNESNEIINYENIASFELIGNDQAFKKNIIKLIEKYFDEELKDSLAEYKGTIDKCVCIFDLDVFSEMHPASKNYNELLETIDFLMSQEIIIDDENIGIEFIILPSYPDIASLILPYYNIDFDLFAKIKTSKEKHKYCHDNCKIINKTNFMECGECSSCILKYYGSMVTKGSRKNVLSIERTAIFNKVNAIEPLIKHKKRIEEIYNTVNLNDFNVINIKNIINEEKVFKYHSCVALLFNID